MGEDQELQELRARIAQLEAGGQKPKPEGGGLLAGCGWVLLFIAGAIVLMVVMAKLNGGQEPTAPTATQEPIKPSQLCNQDHAKGQMMIAMNKGIMTGAEPVPGVGAIIVVRPGAWNALTLDQQKGLATSIDCAVAGPGKHLEAVRFRAFREGNDLTTFDQFELSKLRAIDESLPGL